MIHCNECGSDNLRKKGIRRGLQRYRCNACGTWTYDTISDSKMLPKFEGPIIGLNDNPIFAKLKERYTADELRALANGRGLSASTLRREPITFEGDEVCVGFCTDTHIGEESFDDSLWHTFVQECERQKVDCIIHTGDILEGMSGRPDQVYHLTDMGASAQMAHAETLLAGDIPIYCIDGNHDRWGIKSNGLYAIRDLASRIRNLTFLGSDCGDIEINGTVWRLWHGEDQSSYATSYRIQKLIESFTGGDKPNVLLCGHTHKMGYFFERNIHAVSGGALSYQSSWMKSKRYPCHTGFWIIRATIRDSQIVRFSPTWYPIYE